MLVESFKGISKTRKESMVIISHQERIMKIADEIIIIADGVVSKRGPADEIFPQLMAEFNNNGCTFR
jgi:Fe-S cluster assembly ATP-binding protein